MVGRALGRGTRGAQCLGEASGAGVCGAQAGALWGLGFIPNAVEAAGGFQVPETVWFVLLRAPLGAERAGR